MCGLPKDVDFIKLSVFGVYLNGIFFFECVRNFGHRCNARIADAYRECEEALLGRSEDSLQPKFIVNFVQSDFPEKPGKGELNIVDFCFNANLKRALERGWIDEMNFTKNEKKLNRS